MIKVIITQAVISKGYDNKPAVNITRTNELLAARFRIGKRVYDSKAENNTRWLNYSVKGFGPICDRIEKMQLKEGSFVNLIGRLDEEVWEDQKTHEKKSAPVIILEEIEYASSGGKSKDNEQVASQSMGQATNAGNPAPLATANAGNYNNGFTGYEPFGGNSFFDQN